MVDGKKETALGLGERLRSSRKARALTLVQAAFALRLEPAVLQALEDEHFEALGAAVFVRGHLKAYAKLLGLSEEAVLSAYRAADPNADVSPKVTRELEKPLRTAPGPLAIAAAVGIAVVAVLVLYVLSSGVPPSPSRPPKTVSGTVSAILPPPQIPEAALLEPAPPDPAVPGPPAETPPPAPTVTFE